MEANPNKKKRHKKYKQQRHRQIEIQSHIHQRQRKIKSRFHMIHPVSKARWSRLKIQTGASISQTRRLPRESFKHIVASSFLSPFCQTHLYLCHFFIRCIFMCVILYQMKVSIMSNLQKWNHTYYPFLLWSELNVQHAISAITCTATCNICAVSESIHLAQ